MAVLYVAIYLVSTIAASITVFLMLNSGKFIKCTEELIEEIKGANALTLEKQMARQTVRKKVKNLAVYLYVLSFVPIANIVYIWLVMFAVKTGQIKRILNDNF